MRDGELHIISTDKQPPQQLAEIISRIHHEVDFIHLREKSKTAREVVELVKLLVNENVPLSKIIINDRVDIAVASNVKGVQLAYHSLPVDCVKRNFTNLTIGCSVHAIEEARFAEKKGADYLVCGHIYSTSSKTGLIPKGLELLKNVSESVSIPVIAIGGITPVNTGDVIGSGAKGIAVMSGIFEAKDPLLAARSYRSCLAKESFYLEP